MITSKDILYLMVGYKYTTIPKGNKLVKATNLPQGGWWARSWEKMDSVEKSWQRNYGFHVRDDEK